MTEQRQARVYFDGWSGRRSLRVLVIGESATHYRVRYLEAGAAAGRVHVNVGVERLVPKTAVQFDEVTDA